MLWRVCEFWAAAVDVRWSAEAASPDIPASRQLHGQEQSVTQTTSDGG